MKLLIPRSLFHLEQLPIHKILNAVYLICCCVWVGAHCCAAQTKATNVPALLNVEATNQKLVERISESAGSIFEQAILHYQDGESLSGINSILDARSSWLEQGDLRGKLLGLAIQQVFERLLVNSVIRASKQDLFSSRIGNWKALQKRGSLDRLMVRDQVRLLTNGLAGKLKTPLRQFSDRGRSELLSELRKEAAKNGDVAKAVEQWDGLVDTPYIPKLAYETLDGMTDYFLFSLVRVADLTERRDIFIDALAQSTKRWPGDFSSEIGQMVDAVGNVASSQRQLRIIEIIEVAEKADFEGAEDLEIVLTAYLAPFMRKEQVDRLILKYSLPVRAPANTGIFVALPNP